MIIKASSTIEEYGLLERGDRVIAALSGGADSVALFLFLKDWCAAHGVRLFAAHLNHGLRDTADRDEAFVRALCEKEDVPLFVEKARLAEQGLFSEDAARSARYAFFDRLAAEHKAKVATAHTLQDNAETVLLRLARGTSLAGAGGIPVRRGAYIRPLLFCTRAQIEAFCSEKGQGWVTDETNFSDVYARNRVRLQVLPALGGVNERAAENIAAFAADAAETAAYLEEQARLLLDGQDGADAERLKNAPAPVRRQALRLLAQGFASVDRPLLARMEDALFGKAQRAELCRGVFAGVRRGRLTVWRKGEKNTARLPLAALLCGEKETVCDAFYPFRIRIRVLEGEKLLKICKQNKKQLKNQADYAMINNDLVFCARTPGQRFRPAGRGVTKTVKALLAERGVPEPLRDRLPLLCDGEGRVVWIFGEGFCEELLPTEQTNKVLFIETERIDKQEDGQDA